MHALLRRPACSQHKCISKKMTQQHAGNVLLVQQNYDKYADFCFDALAP